MMSNDDLYKDVIESSFGFSISSIWDDLKYNHSSFSYKERIEKFLFILNRAMESGILRLADDGNFLEGSIDEQVEKFRESFPEKEEYICEYIFGIDIYENIWIPGGAVWITAKGKEIWT